MKPELGRSESLWAVVLVVVLVPSFVLARFGNEAFEAVFTDDVRLSEAAYAAAQTARPCSSRRVRRCTTGSASTRCGSSRCLPATPKEQTAVMRDHYLPAGPVYVILSNGQALRRSDDRLIPRHG